MTTSGGLPADLAEAVRDLCRRRPLLIALDFDGVLAPIVERPEDARPLTGVVELVDQLAGSEGVTVALVSGRARDDLAALSGVGDVPGVLLVGSHGAELDGAEAPALDADARARLDRIVDALREVAGRYEGALVETKPSAGVLHTRRVARERAEAATDEALRVVAGIGGVHVTRGKEVVEVAVTEATKGVAVQALRESLAVTGVLYVGDDVTDETVLGSLGASDVGVKVGDGETSAAYRIASPIEVRELLRALSDLLRGGEPSGTGGREH